MSEYGRVVLEGSRRANVFLLESLRLKLVMWMSRKLMEGSVRCAANQLPLLLILGCFCEIVSSDLHVHTSTRCVEYNVIFKKHIQPVVRVFKIRRQISGNI